MVHRSPRRGRPVATPLGIQSLEPRLAMAASVRLSADGDMTIMPTSMDDPHFNVYIITTSGMVSVLSTPQGPGIMQQIRLSDGSIQHRVVWSVPATSIRSINISCGEYDNVISAADSPVGVTIASRWGGMPGFDRFLTGSAFDDIIVGGRGDDRIFGGAGNDILKGGDGADTLLGEGGYDILVGGADDDVLEGGDGRDTLDGEGGNDTLRGGRGKDVLRGGDGDDLLEGGNGPDTLYGDAGNDTLRGDVANDILYGGSGDDILRGGSGSDTLYGDEGDDALFGGLGNDTLFGGDGDDSLAGRDGDDVLDGGNGDDQIGRYLKAGRWVDEPGNDSLYGGPGNDTLRGGSGNDGMFGGIGWNVIDDDAGADRILVLRRDGVRDDILFPGVEDAVIPFVDAPILDADATSYRAGAWSEADVIRVDAALRNLHAQLGNTRLLERSDGTSMTFSAQGLPIVETGKAAWNSGGAITIVDPAGHDDTGLVNLVYREVGHNWDDPRENRRAIGFRRLSGWVVSETSPGDTHQRHGDEGSWWYVRGTAFAVEYGKADPFEDYATVFAKYFMERYHVGVGGYGYTTPVPRKFANLERLFADLRR